MHTLKLKVIHRFLLIGAVNQAGQEPNHSLQELSRMMKVIEKTDFTDEDKKLYNIRTEDGAIKWNAKAGGTDDGEEIDVLKDFELSDEQYDLVKSIIQKKNDEKKFDMTNLQATLELAEQFEVKVS